MSESDPCQSAPLGWNELLSELAASAGAVDASGAWPEQQFRRLGRAGVLGWVVPAAYGGSHLSGADLIAGYVALSRACLTTAFILTQRNGACQRIAAAGNGDLQAELLPRLCRGELFATVGISHLSTSRQHVARAAVVAFERADGYVLDGLIPWVTGAAAAHVIVSGGTLPDGRQLLAAIPTSAAGVEVLPAEPLLALNASCTGPVALHNVLVSHDQIVSGPVSQVMKQGGGSTGSLATSALAVGLTEAAVDLLGDEAARRPDLVEICAAFQRDVAELRADLLTAARATDAGPPDTAWIREGANSLALRATQAALAASKGAGFVKGHPAERWVREALFFLVWSCPQPVVAAALRDLAALDL